MKRVCVRGMSPNAAGVNYVGRACAGWRASPLHNPCSRPNVKCPVCGLVHFGPGMVQLTPGRSIDCYRAWLWGKLKAQDGPVLAELRSLREDDTVGCWCGVDQPCHGDVVMRAWAWLKAEEARWQYVVRRDATDDSPAADLAICATRKEAWDWLDGQGIVPIALRRAGEAGMSVVRVGA